MIMQRRSITLLLTIILGSMGLLMTTHGTTTAQTQDPWVLVWSDDFNGSSIDTTKWNVLDTVGAINNELHYISPNNVTVANGNLVIRADRQNVGGREYTSGKVTTNDKFEFLYGRVEVRAKMPAGQGLHSAHWLLHHECGGWDPCSTWPPEWDIMEMLGHDPTKVYQSAHYGNAPRARWPNNLSSTTEITIPGVNFSQSYNTFAVEWEPTSVRWYVNGTLKKTFTSQDGFISDEFMYIILDIAVGGNWPGSPDGTTVFPAYHYIDYVKVFKRQSQANPTNTPGFNPPTNTPVVTSPPASGNLIQNAGFESNLSNWTDWFASTTVTSPVYSGSKALRIGSSSTAQWSGIQQNLSNVASNTAYTFSGRGQVGASGVQCYLGIKGADTAGNNFNHELTITSVGSYAQVSKTFTTPVNLNWIQVYASQSPASNYCYLDDLSLTLATTAPNLVQNPGFESSFANWVDLTGSGSSVVTSPIADGTKALRIGSATGSDWLGAYQNINGAVSSKSYTFSVKAQSSANGVQCFIGIKGADMNGVTFDHVLSAPPVGSYAQRSTTFTTPANLNWVQVYAWRGNSSGYCYVDSFSLTAN
jgi:beta-glucanase (GH16 family)